RRIPEAHPEWEVLCEVAARARPQSAAKMHFSSTHAIREEISRAIPLYSGIEALSKAGDAIQWGGDRLFADGRFATPDGKAHFSAVALAPRARREGFFTVSTRRGKQFNSMVQRGRDPLTGAGRDDVLMSPKDARALGLAQGHRIRLVSDSGEFLGRVHLAPIQPGNLAVHFPEGTALLANTIDPESGEPDYNAQVRVVKIGRARRRPFSRPAKER